MFSKNFTSKANSFAPRLQTPGTYTGCTCIKFQELPKKPGSKAVAVLEWKVPNSAATIQDFILDVETQAAADYLVGHAKELAIACGTTIDDSKEYDLNWAVSVFKAVAKSTKEVTIMLTPRTNPNGADFTNARYLAPGSKVVTTEPESGSEEFTLA